MPGRRLRYLLLTNEGGKGRLVCRRRNEERWRIARKVWQKSHTLKVPGRLSIVVVIHENGSSIERSEAQFGTEQGAVLAGVQTLASTQNASNMLLSTGEASSELVKSGRGTDVQFG